MQLCFPMLEMILGLGKRKKVKTKQTQFKPVGEYYLKALLLILAFLQLRQSTARQMG